MALWCRGWDSNPGTARDRILSPAPLAKLDYPCTFNGNAEVIFIDCVFFCHHTNAHIISAGYILCRVGAVRWSIYYQTVEDSCYLEMRQLSED